MATPLTQYLNRTSQVIKNNVVRVLRMQGADVPSRTPRVLFTFNSPEDIQQFATGCDSDIGGTSTVNFTLDESTERNDNIGKLATGRFWGDMRLEVKHGLEGKLRGGYAGFRNKIRPTLFGDLTEDVSSHQYLALRLKLEGDPSTHNSYFVNIQTDGPILTDLWQHRLYFQRNDGSWEDIFVSSLFHVSIRQASRFTVPIPFNNFVRTNSGEMSAEQIEMYRERVRSIGISLLGGNSGAAGHYELGIDSISIVNDEDIPQTLLAPDNKRRR